MAMIDHKFLTSFGARITDRDDPLTTNFCPVSQLKKTDREGKKTINIYNPRKSMHFDVDVV